MIRVLNRGDSCVRTLIRRGDSVGACDNEIRVGIARLRSNTKTSTVNEVIEVSHRTDHLRVNARHSSLHDSVLRHADDHIRGDRDIARTHEDIACDQHGVL